jgi:hypothetical protein
VAIAVIGTTPLPVHAAFGPAMRAADMIDVGAQPDAVAAGDLNGDGLPDLVVGRRDGVISILLHYDTGFYPQLYRPGGLKQVGKPNAVIGVALADMNQDGNLDAVLTLYGYGLAVLLGDGRGDFGTAVFYPAGSGYGPAMVADVNGDGWPDVVLERQDDFSYVLLGTGGGALQAPAAYGPFTAFIVVQDATGDGIADLLEVHDNSVLSIFPGNPNGTFTTSLPPDTLANPDSDAVWQLAVGNMNGDSAPDLVFSWTPHAFQPIPTPPQIGVRLGTGGGSFQPRVSYPSSLFPRSTNKLLLRDMDGNGTTDVVTVQEAGNAFSWIEVAKGNGDGTLGAGTLYGEPSLAHPLYPGTSAILADVDADGLPDMVEVLKESVLESDGYSVAVFRNDGSGGFAQPLLSALGLHPSLPAVADFNHDGKPDLALSDQVTAAVKIAPGDGSGTFTSGSLASLPNPVYSMTAGDFDRNGTVDLVTSDIYNPLQFISNSPTGILASPSSTGASGITHPRSMGDMNRDGIPDLVVDAGAGQVAVLNGIGNGTFFPQAPQFFSVGSLNDLVLGDWNRDGYLDMAGASSAGLGVMLGGPGGALSGLNQLWIGMNWTAVCAGDFNRDGILDLAARVSADSLATPQGIYLWLGDGSGNFTLGQTIPTTVPRGYTIEAVDVNHDGKLDLVAEGVSYSSTGTLTPDAELEVYLGRGDGTFDGIPWADGLIGTPNPEYGPIAVADVDRDGTPDAIAPIRVAGVTISISTIHLNSSSKGNGLLPASFYPTVSGPRSVAAGDLNRDGKLDVVTCTPNASPGVAVHIGTGTGTVGAAQAVAASAPASKVAIADFNRDGIPDIAALSNTVPPYGITAMLGAGNGTTFSVPSADAWHFNAGADFAVGDMNRDGVPDIVASTPDSVRLLLGAVLGGFTGPHGVSLPGCTHLELADLDRDGYLDVVCACGLVKVIHGGPTGLLPPITIPGPVTTCTTLCVADFNRDGFPDIEANQSGQWYIFWGAALSPFSTSAVSTLPFAPNAVTEGDAEATGTPYLYAARNPGQVDVLSVNPTGAIASVGSYSVGSSPSSIALGDFNRDGGLDVVTASATDSTLTVNLHGAGSATAVEVTALAPPARARLLQNYPNPFNPRTTIRYSLSREERVRLAVYDVGGRLVATLLDGLQAAGEHSIPWDGRDAGGGAVGSGVYFYRLTTESGERESKRMVILK